MRKNIDFLYDSAIARKKTHVIRYEELFEDVVKTIHGVYKFGNFSWDGILSEALTEWSQKFEINSHINAWRTKLDFETVEKIETLCKEKIKNLEQGKNYNGIKLTKEVKIT